MLIETKRHYGWVGLVAWLLLTIPGAAFAIDGIVEINQTRALRGGVTPGDAPGFPVTLNESGSYVLTSSLQVNDPDLDGIQIGIGVSDVTVDLNGFTVAGPVACSGEGSGLSCTPPNGNGYGVTTLDNVERITIHNGNVRGFSAGGISVPAESHVYETTVTEIDGRAISCLGSCTVADNIVTRSRFGIRLSSFGTLRGNVVYGTAFEGMSGTQSVEISANVISRNGGRGLFAFRHVTITDNLITDNEGNGVDAGGDNFLKGNVIRENTGYGFSSLVTTTGFVNNSITGNAGGTTTGGTDMASNVCDYDIYCP